MNDHAGGLEVDLEHAFRDGVRRCHELGYNPSYFVRMLEEQGALATARQLITATTPSEGFSRLWELGHLELTVEALVLEPRFAPLFSNGELRAARRRLDDLGFSSS